MCMYVRVSLGAQGGHKSESNLLELDLLKFVSCHESAGNRRSPVFHKSSKCSTAESSFQPHKARNSLHPNLMMVVMVLETNHT